jgi:signal transduction histidine kinase
MQIRTRLTLQFIIVVSLIIALSFGIIYYSSSVYRHNEFYQRLESKANATLAMFLNDKKLDPALLILFYRGQKDKLQRENIKIFGGRDSLLYKNIDSNLVRISSQMVAEVRLKGRKNYSEGPFEILGLSYRHNNQNLVIFTCAFDKYGFSKLNNLRTTMVLLFLLIISIVAFAGWVYSGRALKPLSNVINNVEDINVENLNQRLTASSNKDEIGRLIDTFNLMLEKVEQSVKMQRLFVSGASHELKNPLTSITSQLQVLMLSDRSKEEYKLILQSLIEDIRRLNRTTLDLIEYARLSYEGEIQLSDIRLDDVLWSSRDQFQTSNPTCHVILAFGNLPVDERQLIIKGNDALLKVAFNNLIDNACKFSSDNSCWINFQLSKNELLVSFNDKGLGMTEQEMLLIFEPFYRANNTAEVKGHGIGLALTKKIVKMHEGKITVESTPLVGTEFKLSFPILTTI